MKNALLWPFHNLPSRYIVLDSETTGLPDEDGQPGMVTVGLALVDNGKVVDGVEFKVKPHRSMHPQATKVNGITDEMAQAHPEFVEQWPQIKAWLDGNVVVIQNAVFDWTILIDHIERYGVEPPKVAGVFCSQRSAQPWAVVAGMPCSDRGPSLDKLTRFLGVEDFREQADGIHGAEMDARQTAMVVESLRRLYAS